MKNFQNDEERQKLYNNGGHLMPEDVHHADPVNHTMGPDNFKKYIGRYGQAGLGIDRKKISDNQAKLIGYAYIHGLLIHVIGAYRRDFDFIAEQNNFLLYNDIVEHDKPGSKTFNNRRQAMCMVRTSELDAPKELWVLVFPSKQYVDQTAELLQAILDDFETTKPPKIEGSKVVVSHFPDIENQVTTWTGFSDFTSLYVRHGDVVAIGNIELLLPGINDYSFETPDYEYGGLDSMFGVTIAVNQHSSTRLVLIGVKESYWGDASAKYVQSLLNAGAMHILYGSKAATTLSKDEVHKIYSPTRFILVGKNGKTENIEYHRGAIGRFIDNLEIFTTGNSVTVPTVIGESHSQRKSFFREGATCMDCENGHIAQTIFDHNRYMNDEHSRMTNAYFQKRFMPVHYITDYIYNSNEIIDPSTKSLVDHADHATESGRKNREERDSAFRKIGNVFAAYALTFGTQNLGFKIEKINTSKHNDEPNFKAEFDEIKPLLDVGLGRAALAGLWTARVGEGYRISSAMAHLMVCQKEGYINSAYSCLKLLHGPTVSKLLTEREKIHIQVLEVKLNSQIGRISKLSNLFSDLNSDHKIELLMEIKQYGAFKRREAVYRGLLSDQVGSKLCIESAKDHDSESDSHYQYTNILFGLLAELPVAYKTADLKEISRKLSDVRTQYLGSYSTGDFWQTNFERSALAALFLESSYYLCSQVKASIMRGARTLAIAHLLNLRLGGNEVSETYGEIIACTPKLRVKNIISLAMRKDPQAQVIFQRWINSEFDVLSKIALEFKKMFLAGIEKREEEIQDLLVYNK